MTTETDQYRAGFEAAEHSLKRGEEYPYDTAGPAKDWAHAAARGILYDLNDRRGIKHELRAVEPDVRDELTASLADIIRAASKREASTEPSAKPVAYLARTKRLLGEWSEWETTTEEAFRIRSAHPRPDMELIAVYGAGALPDEAKDAVNWRELLAAVIAEIPQRNYKLGDDAPGHSHRRRGIWDDFNGAKSGMPCAWCKVWNSAVAAIQAQAKAGKP